MEQLLAFYEVQLTDLLLMKIALQVCVLLCIEL